MTSHEKRVNALIRLHGMTKATAEKRARELEKTVVKKNPAKKKPAKKKPAKKNPIIPGITARPIKATRKTPIFAVEHGKAKTGPWITAGLFPNRTLADEYCRSKHEQTPEKYWRVVLK